MHRNDKIRNTLQFYYDSICKKYNEDRILGVFLYGSQNYNFDTEESDIDARAIFIPNIKNLCLDKQPISKKIKFEMGECEIKDIREMVKMFKKQNINFLELLFTPFCILNLKYINIWENYFIYNREDIAHMDFIKAINSITGQAFSTLKKKPLTGKKFANTVRVYDFLNKYLNNYSYEDCLNATTDPIFIPNHKILLEYKTGKRPVTDDIVIDLTTKIHLFKDRAIEQFTKEFAEDDLKLYNKCSQIMNDGIIALITNDHINFDFYKEFPYTLNNRNDPSGNSYVSHIIKEINELQTIFKKYEEQRKENK